MTKETIHRRTRDKIEETGKSLLSLWTKFVEHHGALEESAVSFSFSENYFEFVKTRAMKMKRIIESVIPIFFAQGTSNLIELSSEKNTELRAYTLKKQNRC